MNEKIKNLSVLSTLDPEVPEGQEDFGRHPALGLAAPWSVAGVGAGGILGNGISRQFIEGDQPTSSHPHCLPSLVSVIWKQFV